MFCLFYDLYFVPKSLVTVESGKQATFYDYAGPFFLKWFFPIGIWFIQPRINRLYARQASTTPIIETGTVSLRGRDDHSLTAPRSRVGQWRVAGFE